MKNTANLHDIFNLSIVLTNICHYISDQIVPISAPGNGAVSVSAASSGQYGAYTATHSCNEGYSLVGTATQNYQCGDAAWDGTTPTCEADGMLYNYHYLFVISTDKLCSMTKDINLFLWQTLLHFCYCSSYTHFSNSRFSGSLLIIYYLL